MILHDRLFCVSRVLPLGCSGFGGAKKSLQEIDMKITHRPNMLMGTLNDTHLLIHPLNAAKRCELMKPFEDTVEEGRGEQPPQVGGCYY